MKQLIIISLFLLSFTKITATEQQNDILYINGEKYHILNKILNRKIIGQYIDDRDNLKFEINSSLWRGYIAEYEISDNFFQIKDILIPVNFTDQNFIKLRDCDETIFETLETSINTLLIVSKEDTTMHNVGKELLSIRIIEIHNNKVVKNIEINSCEDFIYFRNDQFQKYKLTDYYKKDHYYSLKTIRLSRERYKYGNDIPIEEEVDELIVNNMFKYETFTHIL